MREFQTLPRAIMMLFLGATALLPLLACGPSPGPVETADLGGGVGLETVWIPAGRFRIGSLHNEAGRSNDEGLPHTTELDGFWLGKYEVTQEQYERVMGTNPSIFKGPRNPVENVSWNDAMAFCRKLSDQTATTFTLPTEAQWEYACRAKSQKRYFFGDSEGDLGEYAWYSSNAGATTHPVGEKTPNRFGLYDMGGNVWEWCRDYYFAEYYDDSPLRNPENLTEWEGRVLRGGSWLYGAVDCRSARRFWAKPADSGANIGFRVARPGPPPK